jgi:hypothetical protein
MALPSKKKACTQRDHVFQGTAELDSSSGDGGNQKVALFFGTQKKNAMENGLFVDEKI